MFIKLCCRGPKDPPDTGDLKVSNRGRPRQSQVLVFLLLPMFLRSRMAFTLNLH